MTVSISNLNFTWANSSIIYTSIGVNVNASSYGANSKIMNLRVNSNTVFSIDSQGHANTNSIRTKVFSVSELPSPSSVGEGFRVFVRDANLNSFFADVYSGGSNVVPVFSDGSVWKIG
jgi:hypothetical protein